jgi:hypothetical protein
MKRKVIDYFWGAALVVAGVLFLAYNVGIIEQFRPIALVIIFSVAAALFLGTFAVYGPGRWVWLIPGCISAGLALTVITGSYLHAGEAAGAVMMASIALPFWLTGAAAPRERWWAFIPAWVCTALAGVILLAGESSGEVIGALFMWATGAAFLVVFLRVKDAWWALIPAGAMATVGLVIVAAGLKPGASLDVRLMMGVLFGGLGLTFALLWLGRGRYPTAWAIYPAAGLAVAAVVAATFGPRNGIIWPVIVIGAGLWLIAGRGIGPKPKG